MATLITSYWGESTTEDLALKAIYSAARDDLAADYNKQVPGALTVIDRAWLGDDTAEHFLVRGREANALSSAILVADLLQLLNAGQDRTIGTGVAAYGSHAPALAQSLRAALDPMKPRGLRFVAGEVQTAGFTAHLRTWLRAAADDVIARASWVESEMILRDLDGANLPANGYGSWHLL